MTASPQEPPFATAPPNAQNYRDFRMVAEWASAIRGNSLHFTYGDGTGRMSVELAEHGLVLTPPNALRPVVTQVELTVPGAKEPLPLDGHDCSALFWSESAVEKFLFPRFASAAADDASRFLGRLSDAWYGYPGRVVQVCALAYRYGVNAPLSELSLESSVLLVCLERSSGRLTKMGLNEFEKTYPVGAARGTSLADSPLLPEPTRLTGWPAERLDSILAREAAELVSGLRGHYVWFTLEGGTLTPWIAETEVPGIPPTGTVVAHGVAVAVRPDRPAPSNVVARLESGDENPIVPPPGYPYDSMQVPDAMFWTDGAVEKLLLPYYASVKGRRSPFFIATLMEKWDGWLCATETGPERVAAALEHYFPATAADGVDEDPPISDVYAITHLPRSEYVSDAGMADPPRFTHALEHRTALLTFQGGAFRSHPLFGG